MMLDLLRPYLKRFQALPGAEGVRLRWGIVLIGVIVVWAMLFVPYIDWRAHKIEWVNAQSAKLQRLQGLTKASASWKQADIDFQQELDTESTLFFHGSSYAVAQTSLLQYLRKNISHHHLTLESQRLLNAEMSPAVGEKIAIHLRLKGELSELLAFMDTLAQSSYLLTMESVYIASVRDGEALLQLELAAYRPLVDEGQG
jgi:Tfp pilus assembly protein PilO